MTSNAACFRFRRMTNDYFDNLEKIIRNVDIGIIPKESLEIEPRDELKEHFNDCFICSRHFDKLSERALGTALLCTATPQGQTDDPKKGA